MVWIALTAAFAALLAQHLGLAEELAGLAMKAARCPKCTTFWVTLVALLYSGYDVIAAIALSMLMAYLSFWAGFLLIGAQKLYDVLWQKINKKK